MGELEERGSAAGSAEETLDRLDDLKDRQRELTDVARVEAVRRQHDAGKLTARERISKLFDLGTFMEIDAYVTSRSMDGIDRPGDGVVTGWGLVHGRRVCASSQDFTVRGGSLGERHGARILKVMEMAERMGCPIVAINDSAGASVAEGVDSLAAYGDIARRHVRLSGVVPQISMALGPCAGGAAYTPALTDFVVVVDGISQMFVTGPEVVQSAMGSNAVSKEELGGARACAEVNGNAHYLAADETDAFDWVRTLLAHLPANYEETPPPFASSFDDSITPLDRTLDSLMPANSLDVYDMREVLEALLDGGDFLEIQKNFGGSLRTGFGVISGATVGVVASNPEHCGGAIDIDASEKAARFVRFCDAFGLPLLTIVDVPGYLPGLDQERRGIVRRGAKLLSAYSEATVPLVTVIVRKAYGGGYVALGSRHLGADVVVAWPSAEIAVMGAEAMVGLMHRRELEEATNADDLRRKLIEHYRYEVGQPYAAASAGHIDAVIAPRDTRLIVAQAIASLRSKDAGPKKKHNTMPV